MSTIRFTFYTFLVLLLSAPLVAQQQMKATRSQVIPWGSPVSNIYIDIDNNRWVAHKKGLSKVFGLNLAAEAGIDAGQTSLASLKGGNAHIVWDDAALQDLIGDVTLQSGIYDELREEIWLGTAESGLFCIKTKPNLQLVEEMTTGNSKLRSNTINDFLIDTRNRLWIATDDGVLLRESGKWTLIEKGLRIESVANNEDEIWLMGDDLLGSLNSKNTWILIDIPSGKSEGAIKDIDVDAKGQLWIASGIVSMYNPEEDKFSVFGPAQEYTSQFATCIAVDNTGIPWVGTRDKGVYFIQEGAVFAVLSEIVSQADCSGDGTAELIVKVEGAQPPFQYNWSGGLQGKNPKSVPPGTYEVTVTDSRGLTGETSVVVPDNSLSLSVQQDAQADNGQSNGVATVNVEGGQAAYRYTWDNGQTTATAKDLSPGIHKVTVTDSENCTAIAEVEISEGLEKLTLNIIESGEISCDGKTGATVEVVAQGGQAPYSYKWDKAELSGSKVSGLFPGNYNLTATDAQGNKASLLVNIDARDIMELSVSQVGAASVGGSDGQAQAQVNKGVAPYSYVWDNGEQAPLARQLSPGSHSVTVTDAKGCTATASVDISEDILPLELSLEVTSPLSCDNSTDGALQANVRGGKAPYTYKWTGTDANKAEATQLPAQTYELEVTDSEGTSQKATIELTAPLALELTVSQKSPASTNGSDGVALVEPHGGTSPYSYAWDNGESTAEAQQLTPGKHVVTVTDKNGCSTSVALDITEDILPLQVSLEAVAQISCFGKTDGALEAKVSGGKAPYTYTWKGTDATTASASQLSAQKYELEVSDAEGQRQKAKIELSAPPALELSLSQTSPASTGNQDGIAVATIKGGTTPYNISWDSGATTAEAKQLAPGTHSVTVTDANGCSISGNINISEDILPLQLALEVTKEISCSEAADGQITANIIGGKPPYQYAWTATDATTKVASDLGANEYSLEVTDAAGQKQSAKRTISAPPSLELSLSQTSPASTGNQDGIAVATVKGGTTPYNISWDNGATTAEAKQLAPGTHSVTVTDANGCSISENINISEDILPLQLALEVTKEISCSEAADGQITANIIGGKPPYQYAWTATDATTEVASDLGANEYSLEVTDAAGQKQSAKRTISAPKLLEATVTVQSPASTGNNDGVAIVAVKGGRAPYTYAWSSGSNTEIAEGLSPGIQSVTVSDASGCQASGQVEITENILPLQLTINEQSPVRCHEEQNGMLIANVSGGKAPYYYNWSHNSLNSPEAKDLGAGIYSLTVTDITDTEQVISYELEEPAKLTISATVLASASTNQSDGKARIDVSGGTGAYTYRWKDGNTSAETDKLSPGMHTVVVTDERNCETSVTFEVTEDILPLEVSLTLSQALSCADINNAALEAAVSGGKPPYDYQWNQASLSGSGAYDLGPGDYQLTVSDVMGTEKTASYTIPALTAVSVEITKMIPALTATSEDGQATANANGGTPPYDFNWDSGASTAKAENLAVGNHRVTVTDSNGCTAEAEVEVVERVMKELASGALKSGQVINMRKLEFDADSIVIREDAIPIINEVHQFLEDNPSIVVEIGGHTNNLPPPAYCDSLSTNRARVVAEYIVQKGISPDRVYYRGYGKRNPIFSNGTEDGRRRNQRVEIKILKI